MDTIVEIASSNGYPHLGRSGGSIPSSVLEIFSAEALQQEELFLQKLISPPSSSRGPYSAKGESS